jgi:hypothetical protein
MTGINSIRIIRIFFKNIQTYTFTMIFIVCSLFYVMASCGYHSKLECSDDTTNVGDSLYNYYEGDQYVLKQKEDMIFIRSVTIKNAFV